jgi:hypothetical protein
LNNHRGWQKHKHKEVPSRPVEKERKPQSPLPSQSTASGYGASRAGDTLDFVFEGVERMACGSGGKKQDTWISSLSKNRSISEVAMRKSDDPQTTEEASNFKVQIIDNTYQPTGRRKQKSAPKSKKGQDASHKQSIKGDPSTVEVGDISDYACDALKQFSCRHDVASNKSQIAQGRDFVGRPLDGVEKISCRQGSTQQKKNKRTTTEMKKKAIGSAKSSNYTIGISLNESPDMLDSLCTGVESAVCRDRDVEFANERDLFDYIFEPDCAGNEFSDVHSLYDYKDNDNSMVASVGSAIESPETPRRKGEGDLLDYIFENVESRTCRPGDDDLSTIPMKREKSKGENWGRFRVFK